MKVKKASASSLSPPYDIFHEVSHVNQYWDGIRIPEVLNIKNPTCYPRLPTNNPNEHMWHSVPRKLDEMLFQKYGECYRQHKSLPLWVDESGGVYDSNGKLFIYYFIDGWSKVIHPLEELSSRNSPIEERKEVIEYFRSTYCISGDEPFIAILLKSENIEQQLIKRFST